MTLHSPIPRPVALSYHDCLTPIILPLYSHVSRSCLCPRNKTVAGTKPDIRKHLHNRLHQGGHQPGYGIGRCRSLVQAEERERIKSFCLMSMSVVVMLRKVSFRPMFRVGGVVFTPPGVAESLVVHPGLHEIPNSRILTNLLIIHHHICPVRSQNSGSLIFSDQGQPQVYPQPIPYPFSPAHTLSQVNQSTCHHKCESIGVIASMHSYIKGRLICCIDD